MSAPSPSSSPAPPPELSSSAPPSSTSPLPLPSPSPSLSPANPLPAPPPQSPASISSPPATLPPPHSSSPSPPSTTTISSSAPPPPPTTRKNPFDSHHSTPSHTSGLAPPPPSAQNSGPGSSSGTSAVAIVGVLTGVLLLGFIGIAIWCLRRQKERVSKSGAYDLPPESDMPLHKIRSSAPLIERASGGNTPPGLGNSRTLFAYEELLKATNDFSTKNLLGEGGFGCVYKGSLPDGREVAVKQLKIEGSKGEGRPVLDWTKRVKIAAGAARGIAYLHEDCNPRIIHRDIKSANILLHYNFEARISDFGLAKLAVDANTHVTTRVVGTFGYVAPEYVSSGKFTEKSDVYSFGVMLLELITGRKPVDISQPVGEESLVEWARPLLTDALDSEEFESLTDPKLGKNYVESEMICMLEVAAACVRYSSAKRPRMGQVVRALDSLATCDLSNGMRIGDSALQSAEIRLFRRMAFGIQDYNSDFLSPRE
ncbi:hypothetical protein GLYMA_16G096900v4 [Glycine max]|nr:hypothetical protein GLYMA_16G096900v4 [Glycine max]KAH1150740.1 hypothetical protein GYH30_044647 [Glycine max]